MEKKLAFLVMVFMIISMLGCSFNENGQSETTHQNSTSAGANNSGGNEQTEKHTHQFSEATCTDASKCTCGEKKGTALGHDLANGTCTVCGIKPEYNIGNLLILGDSISTFEGYIPQDYATWYMPVGNDATDVKDVNQTWWSIFAQNTNANIVRNDSYSGSTICYTGYGGSIHTVTSYIGRFDHMLAGTGFFDNNKIDTVVIFGGTNDSWAGSPIGEEKYSDWTEEDKESFLPAFCYLIDRIQSTIPDAEVVCVINENLSTEVTNGMQSVCEHYKVEYVKLSGIDVLDGHPSIAGMVEVEKQIRRVFEENN